MRSVLGMIVLLAFFCFCGAGCVHNRYKTVGPLPEKPYAKVLVVAGKPGIEKKLVKALRRHDVEAVSGRVLSGVKKKDYRIDVASLLEKTDAQAILHADINPVTTAHQVPAMTHTYVDYYTTEKHGKVTVWERTTKTYTPAHTEYSMQWQYCAELEDVATRKPVWEGSLTAFYQPAFSNYFVAGKMVRKMKKAWFLPGAKGKRPEDVVEAKTEEAPPAAKSATGEVADSYILFRSEPRGARIEHSYVPLPADSDKFIPYPNGPAVEAANLPYAPFRVLYHMPNAKGKIGGEWCFRAVWEDTQQRSRVVFLKELVENRDFVFVPEAQEAAPQQSP